MRIGFHIGPVSLSGSTKRRRKRRGGGIAGFFEREAAKVAAEGPRTDLTDQQRAMVADMNSGMTKHEIGEKYGIPEHRVMSEMVKRHRAQPGTE